MTNHNPSAAMPVLGINSILSDSFNLVADRSGIVISMVVAIYGTLIASQYLVIELRAALGPLGGFSVIVLVIEYVLYFSYFAAYAIVVRLALDLKTSGRLQIRQSIAATFSGLVPIMILSVLSYLAIGLGLVVLVFPGLLISTVLFVMIPAVVFEGAGFGAARRSNGLVKGYRSPVMALVVLVMCANLFGWATLWGVTEVMDRLWPSEGLAPDNPGINFVDLGGWVILDTAINGATSLVSAVICAMTYLRLRQIKEGGETSHLLQVFE